MTTTGSPDEAIVASSPLDSAIVRASVTAYGRVVDGVRTAHHDSEARVGPPGITGPTREERESLLDALLAPGATRSVGAGRRAVPEAADPFRTCFERDRDRIKYSRPFRRLAGKCQVFLSPDDSHVRTRLTHTLEVAQVAVSIAEELGLNAALAEAIALAHDCGHGPGGHAAEDALSPFVPGGYDHAVYGADVTLTDLNLTAEVLDGVRHHSWRLTAPSTPEAEAVSLADRLAYVAHDADDAIRAGIIRPDDLPGIVRQRLGDRQSAQIRALIRGVVDASRVTGRVAIDLEVADALDAFRRFNYERIYHRPAAAVQARRVVDLLAALVEYFADAPGLIPAVASGEWAAPTSGDDDAYAASVHYVSGMTDRFAVATAVRAGLRLGDLPVVL